MLYGTSNTNARSQRRSIDEHEKRLTGIENGLQKFVNDLNVRLEAYAEMVHAVIEIVGDDSVRDVILENRCKKSEEAIALAVAEGRLQDAAEGAQIGPGNIFSAIEYKPDGSVEAPGRFYANFDDLSDEAKKLFAGHGVNDSVIAPATGNKVVFTKLWVKAQAPASVPAPFATESTTVTTGA